MALYQRLCGETTPRISAHDLTAALAELERGKITAGQVATYLSLDAGEQTELATLVAKVVPPREAIPMVNIPAGHALTNVGAAFDAIAASQNMGFVQIQIAGITEVIFSLRVNKIGTGTQSWQLWNDTDGSEVTVIDDAGGTGLKFLTTTKTFGTPLAPGMKVFRIRAKSTTAADDPILFSAMVNLRRVGILTGAELNEILCMAGRANSPYLTSSALQTRLGV